MKETIEKRELIVLDGLGVIIRGTYHKTYDDTSGAQSNLIERNRIGVLFLNSLSPTRAAHGDSAVYWADSFAERGYPSFRLDLPGFGDSEGDPPTGLLGFTHQGGYASIASVKIRELVTRFNLSGVVIVEQCAGGVSTLYTAASCPECKGLVLMDPYFPLPEEIRPAIRRHWSEGALQSCRRLSSNIYDPAKKLRLYLRGTEPSENAKLPIPRGWKEVASTGLPVLILTASSGEAHGIIPRVGEFDYFEYVLGLAGRRSQVVVTVLDCAGHSFASRRGRATVRQRTEQWLNACFPLIKH
jgi:pimeloyl-ACP methyl ester carboxylesterase